MATLLASNGDAGISTGNTVMDSLWALHENGCVFCRPVSTMGFASSSSWTRTPAVSEIKHIAADTSGSVWAIFEDGSLNRRLDITENCPEGVSWQVVDFKMNFADICFGKSGVWALSHQRGVLHRPSMDEDEKWQVVERPGDVSESSMTSVTVDGDGTVYVMASSGDVYARSGGSGADASWSSVAPPPVINQSMWRLLGMGRARPRALTAASRCLWCVVGENTSTELWRRPITSSMRSPGAATMSSSPTKALSSSSSGWEQTSVARSGLANVTCSRDGVHAGALWAVSELGRVVFCPNASVREAAALEWIELDPAADGWLTVCLCARSRRRSWPTGGNGDGEAAESGDSDSDAGGDDDDVPMEMTASVGDRKATPTRRSRQRRQPPDMTSSDMEAAASGGKSKKRHHSDDEDHANESHASQKYRCLGGELGVGIRLPFPAVPKLQYELPPTNVDEFMQQFDYPFTLETEIIAAVENTDPG